MARNGGGHVMRLNRIEADIKLIMDDNSAQLSHQNGQYNSGVGNATSQLGGNSGGISGVNNTGGMNNVGSGLNNKQMDGNNQGNSTVSHEQIYSIPGVLHFIQHEFSRFEIERSQWDVDRAELLVSLFPFFELLISIDELKMRLILMI